MASIFDLDSTLKAIAEESGMECQSFRRVVIDDVKALDVAFFRVQPDKERIRRALDNGIAVPGAHLEDSYMLVKKGS